MSEEPVPALATLQSAAQANPHDAGLWLDLTEALIDHDDLERARLAVRHAHALAADLPAELVRASRAYRRLEDPIQANNAARRALHLDPSHEGAALEVADLLVEAGDPQAAMLTLRVAAHQHPESRAVHLALARASLGAERVEDALRYARRAQAAAPKDPEVLRVLAETFGAMDRPAEELAVLEAVVDGRPEEVAAAVRLGELLARQDRRAEAAALLSRVAESPPRDAQTLVRLGIALTRAHALVPAVRSLREAIRINPDNAQAHFHLGRALGAGGALKEAIGSLQTASGLDAEDPAIGLELGRALRSAGRIREASAALIRAAAAAPDDARIQDELADTLATLKTPSQGTPADRAPTPLIFPKAPIPDENTDGGFTGDLAVFSLPELLEFLGNQRASGELALRHGDETGAIQLHKGAVGGVVSPTGKSLGELLVDGELITHTDLKRSVVRPQDLGRDAVVAQVVLEQRLVEKATVEEFLRRRILDGICELVRWRTGSVRFRRRPDDVDPPLISVDSRWLLLEAMRRLDEDNR